MSMTTVGPILQLETGADPQSKGVTLGARAVPPSSRQDGKMNARNDVKRPFDHRLGARLVPAAVQLRFAARVDFLVARWLKRCATNAEAAQRSFKTPYPNSRIPNPVIAFALLGLVSLVVAGCDSGREKEEAQPERPALTIKV